MKELKFKTLKGNFILIDADSNGRVKLPTDIEYQELGRVKNMTEEQFAEVVDKLEWSDGYFMYYRYDKSVHNFAETWMAKDSFLSLIQSLGWNLWENPNDKQCGTIECQEAESKTLYNPILLKKL